MSKVTVKQAAFLTGKSRETINAATKSGKLSFTIGSKNTKEIDIAELERVYPLIKTVNDIMSPSEVVQANPTPSDSDSTAELAALNEKLAASERMRETIDSERARERRQLEDAIDNLREALAKTQEQHNKALLLITDQSQQTTERVGGWEKSARSLEKRIANQEERSKKFRDEALKARRQVEQYRRALEAERNKPFWQRLIGE